MTDAATGELRGRWFPFVVLAAVCAVLGVVLGVAWWLIAPTPRFVTVDGGLAFASNLPGEFIAADGWFAVLGLVAGVIVSIVVLKLGRVGPAMLLAAGVFGLLGSLLAWGVGRLLGPDKIDPRVSRALGTVVHGPLSVQARGVVLIWPVATLAVLTFVLAWQSPEQQSPETHAAPVDEPATDASPADESVGGEGDLRGLDGGQ